MSFRLFIYYCTAWGAAAAFLGWVLGQMIETETTLTGAGLKGLILGAFVAAGLGLLDALASGAARDAAGLVVRLTLALAIGAAGGYVGGLIGQWLYQLSGNQWSAVLVLGWTLTGVLIGAAPSAFDYLGAVLRNEDRRGARRKVRNGLIGGAVGGLIGGIVSVLLRGLWTSLFKDTNEGELWSPTATGFAALGACIGLAVATAQIVLREAWLRVEAGFRPGRQILITKPETSIGRAESCDVGLFGDAAVEKVHARIKREGNQWVVSDVGTSAGTLVNGQRLAAPAPLRPGDRIQVGGCILAFDVKTKEPAPAPAAVPVSA